MTAVRDILRDSLMLIGAIAPGEALQGEDGQDCLRRLNAMLSSWATESLMIYTLNRDVYPLVIGTQTYTMGPGGTLTAIRPVKIEYFSIIPVASQPDLELKVKSLSDSEWRDITIKTLQKSYPTAVHSRDDFPANSIDVWPIPSATCSVVIYSWQQLGSFTTMNQDVSFPPGYEEALVYNLAIRLAPMYGKQTPPEVVALAGSALCKVKTINAVIPILYADSAFCGDMNGPSLLSVQSRGYVVDP